VSKDAIAAASATYRKAVMRAILGGCLILLVLPIMGCSEKRQVVIFEAESIRYVDKYSESKVQQECSALSKALNAYLYDGWKVVAALPKEKLVANNRGTCIGTEYVLEK
jgi:hypothetical protein